MSAINQMLRDLDARSPVPMAPDVAPDAPAGEVHRPPPWRKPQHWNKRAWMAISLGLTALSIVIVGGDFLLSGAEPEGHAVEINSPLTPLTTHSLVIPPHPLLVQSTRPIVTKETAVPAILVKAPPTASVTPPLPTGDLATPIAKSRRQPLLQTNAQKLTPLSLMSASVSEPEAPKTAEVIKQPVELSPAAAALQLLDEANALRREGKADAAQRKYREALERNPGLSSARIQLAEIMNEQGETEAALGVLKTAYHQQPEADLAVALGRMLANRGQRAEALTWFVRGSSVLTPADHALTAALLAQEQRYPEAILAYQTALSKHPHKGGWLLGLGLAYDATGKREEARTAYRQALAWGEFKPEVIKFLNERSGLGH